jgi:hypothetical protein
MIPGNMYNNYQNGLENPRALINHARMCIQNYPPRLHHTFKEVRMKIKFN